MIIMMMIAISGCYTDKVAYHDMIKANEKYPQKVAEFTRTYYPCFDERDTVILHDTSYDFIEVVCPPDMLTKLDTIFVDKFKYRTKTVNQPSRFVAVPSITKIVNSYIRDSAEINLLEYRLKKSTEDNVELWRKSDSKSTWIMWLIILLAVSLLGNFIQMKK